MVDELVELGDFVEAEEAEAAAGVLGDIRLAVEIAEPDRGAVCAATPRPREPPDATFRLPDPLGSREPVVREVDQSARAFQLRQGRTDEQRVVAGNICELGGRHQQSNRLSTTGRPTVKHLRPEEAEECLLLRGRAKRAVTQTQRPDEIEDCVNRGRQPFGINVHHQPSSLGSNRLDQPGYGRGRAPRGRRSLRERQELRSRAPSSEPAVQGCPHGRTAAESGPPR